MLPVALTLLALLPIQVPACADSVRAVGDSALPWVHLVEHLACERTRLIEDLAHGHARLKARAETEAPALLPRIQAEPPRPRPTGYGLLPELTPDAAESKVALTESRFSLEALLAASAAERRAAVALAVRAESDTTPLEPMVGELERLRRRLSYLESNLSYHRFWQKSADAARGFFAGKNTLIGRVRQLSDLERSNSDSAVVAAFRRALVADVAPFVKTPNLAWRQQSDRTRVLPVEVVTDIADPVFLERFSAAVQQAWNQSEPALARKFLVALTVTRIPPEQLYPEGVPPSGSVVDEAAHLARFPKGALVLTTGGRSLHAFVGRYVQLGTAPISPRVLAHEFGHLLGFEDGYLRGTEGAATDRFGFTLVEWTGILNDLMGAPGIGRVTPEMVERLIEAYSPARPTP